ncbi:hypothetical protein [Paracoccus isoporae]|nr:hypothetical protein [Paracoccus isoporae]
MTATRSAVTVFAALAALPLRAAPAEVVHVAEMGGLYTQTWRAADVGSSGPGTREIFVGGAGKAGDFWGVMHLDCDTPRYSRWVAEGGYLSAEDVPGEAIRQIRARFC